MGKQCNSACEPRRLTCLPVDTVAATQLHKSSLSIVFDYHFVAHCRPITVPAVIDMQPVQSHNATAKGRVQMNESALLMSADATSEAVAGPSDAADPTPEVPTWDPVERWRAQRKIAWVLLIDAAIYFIISMVTFALVNIIVSAAGLAAGIAWFVFFFLRFGTQSAIKVWACTIIEQLWHAHMF